MGQAAIPGTALLRLVPLDLVGRASRTLSVPDGPDGFPAKPGALGLNMPPQLQDRQAKPCPGATWPDPGPATPSPIQFSMLSGTDPLEKGLAHRNRVARRDLQCAPAQINAPARGPVAALEHDRFLVCSAGIPASLGNRLLQ
jgi:hypothetical protein